MTDLLSAFETIDKHPGGMDLAVRVWSAIDEVEKRVGRKLTFREEMMVGRIAVNGFVFGKSDINRYF